MDHVNGDRADNRIENLQAITQAQNNARVVGKGYYPLPSGSWKACISHENKTHTIGIFDTEEEARAAYVKAKKEATEGLQVELD